ncbi:hypothetical protein FXO38_01277 [Capsicum annuum]|nr:hypothetical protein FXO37_09954 [Capsicum annuum]KAF3682472.1 hypothetical protein FXO38_01277 [Capsicum annuum]
MEAAMEFFDWNVVRDGGDRHMRWRGSIDLLIGFSMDEGGGGNGFARERKGGWFSDSPWTVMVSRLAMKKERYKEGEG